MTAVRTNATPGDTSGAPANSYPTPAVRLPQPRQTAGRRCGVHACPLGDTLGEQTRRALQRREARTVTCQPQKEPGQEFGTFSWLVTDLLWT